MLLLITGCVADLEGISPRKGSGSGDAATTLNVAQALPAQKGSALLTHSHPEHGELNVDVSTTVELTFTSNVQLGSGELELRESLSADLQEAVAMDSSQVSLAGRTLHITWSHRLAYATMYEVRLQPNALLAADGTPLDGLPELRLNFTTLPAPQLVLLSTVPERDATAVPLSTTLSLTFDTAVVPSSEGVLQLVVAQTLDVVDEALLSDATRVSFDGDTMSVAFPQLEFGTTYRILMQEGGLQSDQGDPFQGFSGAEFSFTTVPRPTLELISTFPEHLAQNTDPNASIVLTYDAELVPGSGTVSIYDAADNRQVQSLGLAHPALRIVGNSVTVDFTTPLSTGRTYFVTADAGLVLSDYGSGNAAISGPDGYVFSTALQVAPPLTLLGTAPAADALEVEPQPVLELTFSSNVMPGAGYIIVARASDDVAVQTLDVRGEDVSFSGTTMSVTLPAPLRGETEYYVLVGAGAVVNEAGTVFSGIEQPAAFRFTTRSVFELVSTFPANGAVAVAHESKIELVFSEAVSPGSGNIELLSLDGSWEEIPVTDPRVSFEDQTVLVDPDRLFSGSNTFSLRIDGGAFVEAESGTESRAIEPGDWTFTTTPLVGPATVGAGLVLWVDAAYPASLVASGGGIRFWADRSGQGNDFLQGSATARPTLTPGAMNGLDVISFDGSSRVLSTIGGLNHTNLEGFIVWRSPVESSTSQQKFMLINGTNLELNHGHVFGGGQLMASCGGDCAGHGPWYSVPFFPRASANATTLWNFGYSGTSTSLFSRTNGSAALEEPGPSQTPSMVPTAMTLGGAPQRCSDGSCYFTGDVAELIIYSRNLSPEDHVAVSDYLHQKWGTQKNSCRVGEKLGPTGKCYYHDPTAPALDWPAARDVCLARGAGWDLASVLSQEEDAFIISSVLSSSQAWIGASDAAVADAWRWISGSTLFWTGGQFGSAYQGSFTHWMSGEPSDTANTEQCARYRNDGPAWHWADAPCQLTYQYICEGPAGAQ